MDEASGCCGHSSLGHPIICGGELGGWGEVPTEGGAPREWGLVSPFTQRSTEAWKGGHRSRLNWHSAGASKVPGARGAGQAHVLTEEAGLPAQLVLPRRSGRATGPSGFSPFPFINLPPCLSSQKNHSKSNCRRCSPCLHCLPGAAASTWTRFPTWPSRRLTADTRTCCDWSCF